VSSPHIIAELGSNHNGNFQTAMELIRGAKEAGADSVKFQIIHPENLFCEKIFTDGVLGDNPRANLVEQMRQAMLTDDQYRDLAAYCKELEINFTASVFDTHSVDLLCELDVPYIKIASGDLNHISLLRYAAKSGKKLLLSTGASTMEEILHSVDEVQRAGCQDLVVMHCVSTYPSNLSMANLQFIDQLKAVLPWPVGLSDHSPNSLSAVIALSKGCIWFEKHITLDKIQKGVDHSFALELDEFTQFVRDLRDTEGACAFHKEKITDSEKQVRQVIRRSLYAARDMLAGEILREEDITVVRPSGYYSAADIDQLVGRRLSTDIKKYENIAPGHLS